MASAPIDIPVKVKGLNDVDKLVSRMNALEKEVSRLNGKLPKAANGIRGTGRAAKSAAGGVNTLNAAFAKIAVVLGTVTAAVGAFNVSVARTESERKIKILAGAYGEAAQLADIAARASDKFGNSQTETNNALATTYARLRPVGVGLADIESIYGGFNTAARLAGANAQESAGAFRQLAQALGSGALRGDEFNSIAEQAPLVLQAVAAETGLAVGELRDFAATGGITADIVIRALKRIEKEGAGQLAESLKGPQQAIKNFQNAFEDLGAELGKLGEPALIAFFNGLTTVTKAVTANMDKLAKVAQTLFDVIYKPFAALAEGIASTGPKMDGFGQTVLQVVGMSMKIFQDFANLMAPVFNVIGKVIGQALTWFWELAKGIASAISGAAKAVVAGVRIMADAIATLINTTPIGALSKLFGFDMGEFAAGPLNALANGLENVGSAVTGYVDDVRQAGREFAASSSKVTAPVSTDYDPSTLAKTNPNGKGGGGADKAAQEAQREREKAAQQLKSAQDLVFASENQLRLAKEMSELDRIAEEAAVKKLEINKEYGDRLADVKSIEEEFELIKARTNELKTAELEKEEKLKSLREGAVKSIDDEIAQLTAKLEGKEKEYLIEKKIAELKAKGVTNAESKVNKLESLKERAAAADELKAKYEALAGSIAGELTGAFKSIIDGSKTAEEAMSDAFAGIADAFLDMAMKMIAEWLVMQALGIVSGGGGNPIANLGKSWSDFAEGGFVDSPTKAMIGEGSSSEYVIPADKMGSAMSRWNSGARGDSVVNGANASGSEGGISLEPEAPSQINISGGVMQMDNTNYIRQDQIPSIVSQASKQGEARALRRLQMSPAARRKAGVG